MTFALLAATKVNGASGGTTGAIDTTGAKLIVIHAGYSTSSTLTDSKGNTWTPGTAFTNAGITTRFFYCINPTGGTGHTFTIAASVSSMVVSAWSATNTPALDSESIGNAVVGTTFGIIGNASFTPSTNNCLVIGGQSFASPGFTSGYAAASGWTLADVQNYVGGTNYGSSQVYKLQTTATAIPTTEHVSDWTGSVDRLAVGIAFKEVVSAGLTITTPTQYKTFQRSGTTGNIAITGSHTGATEDIEASFNGGAYATIAVASAAGNFSGTLTGQAQGQGTLTVRKKTTTSASATVADIGIGDVFIVGGDSISEGRGTNVQVYTHATLKATKFTEANVWGNGNDPIDTGTSIGSHWPLLATQIMASQNVPVAFVSCGTGSTDVAGSNNQWAKPNSGYAGLIAQAAASGVGAFKGVLIHLGPNAVVNASTLSLATYNSAIDTLAANVSADVAGSPKVLVVVCGEVATGSPPDRRAALDNIRGGIIQAWNDNASTPPGPCLIEGDYPDGVHPTNDAQLLVVGNRWWLAVSQSFYGGTHARGPRVTAANWNGSRNQLTVAFDQVLKTGLTFGTAAWKVSDNGTPMTISGIAYHGSNPNALVISTSAPASGPAATSTVTYASGEDAKGLVVPLSADITMPSGAAIQIPAEPIYAATVNESDVTAPTLSAPSFSGTGTTTGVASVTTDEANGTLYCVVTLSATPPTGAQVRAGQNASGAAAAWAGNQLVSTTGSKTFNASGLAESTTYYPHFQHRDAAGNDSAVSTGAGDSTDAPVITGGGIYVKWSGAYVLVSST